MKRALILIILIIIPHFLYGIAITSGPTFISGTGLQSNPLISVNLSGQAMAIWTENAPLTVETAYFNGSVWFAPIALALGSFPQIGIDGKGNATAIWLSTSSTNANQVFTSRFDPVTMAWESPIQHTATGTTNSAPKIAVNEIGNALAVWVFTTSTSLQLMASTYNVTTNAWSTPVTLVTGTGSFPQVVLDNFNQGIIIWNDTTFGVETITVSVP